MASTPPSLVILGSNTGVGKTWFGIRLFEACQATTSGLRGIKPFETGWDYANSDARKWINAHRQKPSLDDTCKWRLPNPVTPAEELERLDMSIGQQELLDAIEQMLGDASAGFIELAGGVASPLTSDIDCAGLVALLGAPTVLVTTNELGTISSTATAFEYATNHGARPACVVLNHRPGDDDASCDSNAKWIRRQIDAPLFEVRGSIPEELRDFCLALIAS